MMTQPTTLDSTLIHRFQLLAMMAATWAFIFGAINLYWGLGGTIGIYTLGERMAEQALSRDPELLFVNWLSVIGKIVIGVMALMLIRWHRNRFGKLLYLTVRGIGILLSLYGIGNGVQHILMMNGNIPIASSLGSVAAAQWHLLIWDPVWTLGGILFLLTAWQCSKLKRSNH
jgi:hypothetical protein